MTNLTNYVYQDGDKFYFDSENYNDSDLLSLEFEDGDMIKWVWEGRQMIGTLREEGYNLGLFSIEKVSAS